MKLLFSTRGFILIILIAFLFSCVTGGSDFSRKQENLDSSYNQSENYDTSLNMRCPDHPKLTDLWADSSVSSIKYTYNDCWDRKYFKFTNHTFLVSKASCSKDWEDTALVYIISQKQEGELSYTYEIINPKLHATVYKINKNSSNKNLWTLDTRAHIGRIYPLSDDLYETISYDCCEACSLFALYNIKTGKLINEYTSNLLEITLSNTKLRRYIGYMTSNHADFVARKHDTSFIGTLTYSSQDSILQKVTFYKTTNDRKPLSGYLEYVSCESENTIYPENNLALWSKNGISGPKDISGISIKIKFGSRHIRGGRILFDTNINIIADSMYIDTTDQKYFTSVTVK